MLRNVVLDSFNGGFKCALKLQLRKPRHIDKIKGRGSSQAFLRTIYQLYLGSILNLIITKLMQGWFINCIFNWRRSLFGFHTSNLENFPQIKEFFLNFVSIT